MYKAKLACFYTDMDWFSDLKVCWIEKPKELLERLAELSDSGNKYIITFRGPRGKIFEAYLGWAEGDGFITKEEWTKIYKEYGEDCVAVKNLKHVYTYTILGARNA